MPEICPLDSIYKYDTAQTFSYTTSVNRTAIQRGRDPGYSSLPAYTLFFGERGAGEYSDGAATNVVDVSLGYSIPIGPIEPWLKFDVRNALNDDTLILHNISVVGVSTGPNAVLDADGLPTTFTPASTFGRPTAATSYVIPREFLVSAGIRF